MNRIVALAPSPVPDDAGQYDRVVGRELLGRGPGS